MRKSFLFVVFGVILMAAGCGRTANSLEADPVLYAPVLALEETGSGVFHLSVTMLLPSPCYSIGTVTDGVPGTAGVPDDTRAFTIEISFSGQICIQVVTPATWETASLALEADVRSIAVFVLFDGEIQGQTSIARTNAR